MARVLVLDDEPLIAMMIEDWLGELGHQTVGPASSVAAALGLADSTPIDAAILDLSVAGEASYPVAEMLRTRAIPFLFVTGHGADGIAAPYGDAPVLAKPFDFEAVKRAVAKLVAAGGS